MDEKQDIESDIEQTSVEKTEDPSDRLTPDHPRFKAVLEDNRTLKEELAALREQISTKEDSGENTDEEERALQKIKREMEKEGFVKADSFERERDALQFERLSGRYDGSNGYPKFVPVDVVAYAKTNGFGKNYESAYKAMHLDAIVQVESKRTASTPPTSEKPQGGDKQQQADQLTPQDIAAMSDEDYEKNRDKIHAGLRKS